MPFRRAHHVTGSIVKLAEERGCGLADLPLDAMQAIEPGITEDIFSVLSVENAVASRVSDGGTAPEQVRQAVAAAKDRKSTRLNSSHSCASRMPTSASKKKGY